MKTTNRHVFFYTEWPSNFYKTNFIWKAFGEKHEFFCTEQAFMWAKAKYFDDEKTAEKILNASTPMECKHLGRLVNRKTFVEASPTDCIWGIGRSENDQLVDDEKMWKGQNLLGKALTQVREEIVHDFQEEDNDERKEDKSV